VLASVAIENREISRFEEPRPDETHFFAACSIAQILAVDSFAGVDCPTQAEKLKKRRLANGIVNMSVDNRQQIFL